MPEHQHQSAHHEHDHGSSHHLHFDTPEMAAYAEAEAEALVGMLDEATSTLAGHLDAGGATVRRVLDLGSGPGVGTCRLAERFGSATVVAVDGSAAMLERVAGRAERLGLAHRVETRRGELPAVLESVGRADVVWASLVLHHVGDEAGALRRIHSVLEPGGMLALVEKAGPLRVVPGDPTLARSDMWHRLDAAWEAWFDQMRAELAGTTASSDYPSMLAGAGFDVVVDEVLTLDLTAPLDDHARRFAREQLRRTRSQLADHVDAADLEALDALVDEDADGGILLDDGAVIRAERHLYLARALP